MTKESARVAHPNLFIIGAPKCGTTAAYHVLSRLPDVTMSRVKETGFFANDCLYPLGMNYYMRSYFTAAPTTRHRGEASPWYLYSEAAAERIQRDLDAPLLIIALLRNPTDRAISMYRDQVGGGHETRPIEVALTEACSPSGRYEQNYLDQGHYSRHLEPWRERFGDSLHVILAPKADTLDDTRRAFERALGLTVEANLFNDLDADERNVAGRLRHPKTVNGLRHVIRSRPVKLAVRRALPPGLDQRVRASLRQRSYVRDEAAPRIEVPECLITSLDTYYADEVARVRAQWGVDLAPSRSTSCAS